MIPCKHSINIENNFRTFISVFFSESKWTNRLSGNGTCVKCGVKIQPSEKVIPSLNLRCLIYFLSGLPFAIIVRTCDSLMFDNSIDENFQTLSLAILILGPPILSIIAIRIIYCLNLLRYPWIATCKTINNEADVISGYETYKQKRKALVYDAAWALLTGFFAYRFLALFQIDRWTP